MNHFHFAAKSVEKTAEFYETYFGFRRVAKLGRTLVLRNNVGFILGVDEAGENSGVQTNSHIGFTLETSEEVETLFVRMDKNFISTPVRKPSSRATHFYCADPAGNSIEVGWYQF